MTRRPNLQPVLAPVNGLVTDASPLTFPENAFVEGWDVVVDQKAKLTRRKGFEYESGYTLNSVTRTSSGVTRSYEWYAVDGDGTVNFLVVQVDAILHFFSMPSNGGGVSANKKSFTVDLNSHKVSGATGVETERCEMTNGNGVLFVVHSKCHPFYVEYDPDADTISQTTINIEIRDFEGLDDGLDVDERPATLSDEHNYNLDNQGWSGPVEDNAGNSVDPITEWDSHRTDFPSNADIWWYYKDTNDQMDVTSNRADRTETGNTPAPKGHFFLDPFNEDRSAVSGVGSFTAVTTNKRPSAVGFYAGRVFYSGVNDGGWNNNIYYSQIIVNDDEYGKCYQSNDPTSESISDLLDTDGGVIKIPEAGTIIKLFPIGPFLMVFASNGIWTIAGPDQNVFKATDFAISKLSDESATGRDTIISVQGTPYWWNTDGIHTAAFDNTLGSLSIQELSKQKIDDFFTDIPSSELQHVTGTYNPREEVITWLFRSTASSNSREANEFDRALCFNRLTQAFYPWTISQPIDGPTITGVFTNKLVGTAQTKTYFITLVPVSGSTYNLTVSETWDTDYLDWTTFDSTGTDYSSYCTAGYTLAGQGMMDFNSNYVLFLMETETNSSCIVRGLWSYATNSDSGKYSVGQQMYPANSNVGYQERKLKLRGEGRSLQIKFESETGKPFTVVGYVLFTTSDETP